ncbi:adenosine deaminase [Lapidilactobacillus bayanensis]|uniref:adenosine deaminase n=1 Tax=Lapidilactobacillus bayanensis TaxID=2485998 RepID=UPI000F777292|nr:adenosine deaminase [Lapidilactobacillus bayanensis]
MLTAQELKALPKVELHCHLDGSLSLKAIRRLAQMANVQLPQTDTALRDLVSVPDDIENLLAYLKRFDVILPLLQTKEALELAAYDVIEQCAAENVRYIEVRFAPDFSTEKNLSVAEAIAAVLKGLQRAKTDFGVASGLLVCAMRQYSNARSQAMFQAAQPFLGQGLVGGDFAGNEADFPTEVIAPALKTAQELGIPMTLHAGESHCVHNVMAALALGVRRFGHGVALGGHPDFQKQVSQAGGVLEMCLTSNLQTKAIPNIASYPVAELLANHVKITINTDNRTVSNTNLTKEYELWQQYFGITKDQFHEFNLNAINAAFCSETIRRRVIGELNAGY